MSGKIERASSASDSISLTSHEDTTQIISFGSAAGGIVIVDAVADGASSITWCVSASQSDYPVPLIVDGAVVTTSIEASKAYVIPDGLFSAQFIAAVLNAGTATIRVCAKG